MQRRDWLKLSGMLAGGLYVYPQVAAAKGHANIAIRSTYGQFPSDIHEAILKEQPQINARLMSNENPFGPSPKAKEAIRNSIDLSYQYPWTFYGDFKKQIAEFEGVEPENVLVAAGSSEILSLCAVAFGKDGGNMVSAHPTFWSMMEQAERLGCAWKKVPLKSDFSHDFEAMASACNDQTRLIYVVNPNNPTGTLSNASDLEAFCESMAPKIPVMVDEAYFDYLPAKQRPKTVGLIKKGLPVILTRTFSKIYGFAGLRIGYAIAPTQWVERMSLFQSSGTISYLSIQAAMASYEDAAFKKKVLDENEASKIFLQDTLKAKGYTYLPSYTNFVFVPLDKDGEAFRKRLLENGVAIRNWEVAGKHYLRVSLSTLEDMKLFKKAFDTLA